MLQVGRQQADRGVQSRRRRNQHRPHAERARDRNGLHWSGAAGGHKHIVARIDALFDRNEIESAGHLGIGDVDDRLRGLDQFETGGLGGALKYGFARKLDIELGLATEEVIGIEATEHEVGVRQRRLGAAAAVARRPGNGARALRADGQHAARIDIRDRAAAGTDLHQADDRGEDRIALAALRRHGRNRRRADLELIGDLRQRRC